MAYVPLHNLIQVRLNDGRKNALYMLPDVHAAMVEVGKVWKADDKWWCGPDMSMEGLFELAVCDFCIERPVMYQAKALPFIIHSDGPTFTSDDDWYACQTCGDAIVAGNRSLVQRRTLAKVQRVENPAESYYAAVFQLELLNGFWRCFQSIEKLDNPYMVPVK